MLRVRRHRRSLGFILGFLSGTLVAQVVPGAKDRAVASPEVGASISQPLSLSFRPHEDSFVIGNDDRLSINVWKEPDFAQQIPVRSDGRISLPLIGEVQAAGRTPQQLQQDITGKLQAFINQPEVTVMVLQINSQKFNILGHVVKPGSYSLSATTTVLDAIAQAGGLEDFAKQTDIYILRQNPASGESRIAFNYKDVIRGKHIGQNILLQSHDTIIVP